MSGRLPRCSVNTDTKRSEDVSIAVERIPQMKRDAGEDEIPTVMFKRNRSQVYVALPFEEFMDLYMAWEKEQKNGFRRESKEDS